MRIRLLYLPVISALALAGTACNGGGFALSYREHRPARVRHVHKHVAHVRTMECEDCYYEGGRLVVIKGHRHGPGCGHFWNGKHWVRVNRTPAEKHHLHGPGSGHHLKGKHSVEVEPQKAEPHKAKPNTPASAPPKKKIKPDRPAP